MHVNNGQGNENSSKIRKLVRFLRRFNGKSWNFELSGQNQLSCPTNWLQLGQKKLLFGWNNHHVRINNAHKQQVWRGKIPNEEMKHSLAFKAGRKKENLESRFLHFLVQSSILSTPEAHWPRLVPKSWEASAPGFVTEPCQKAVGCRRWTWCQEWAFWHFWSTEGHYVLLECTYYIINDFRIGR